jgi:hypothetical protein
MRKGLSILSALIILFSGTQFFIAMHFCGNELAATKVSLSGKLASCGMEGSDEMQTLPGSRLIPHCCENKVTAIGVLCNFTFPVSSFPEYSPKVQSIDYQVISQTLYSQTISDIFYTSISPPGRFAVSSVNLDDICISRI